MSKTVVLAGSLDTKGPEFAFVKNLIEEDGVKTLVIDFGVMGDPYFPPDIGREEVAAAGSGDIAELADGDHKDVAMKVMADGLAVVMRRLYDEGKIDGVLGMGGGGNTSIATSGMRTLPVGFPKIMVSTMGGGDVSPYTAMTDIMFLPSVVDVAGINSISRQIYTNAAGAIVGMVNMDVPQGDERPLIAASMFGNTTAAVDRARGALEKTGYEVLVFHAVGTGGRTMENLISAGFIEGSLDITTTELADYVCGGVLSAGPERCLAASRSGTPAVLVPGCVDMANFQGIETIPDKYRDRNLYQWNPDVTLLRTNTAENRQIGELIAAAANEAVGPVTILLPLQGVSMLDSPGGRFWDPEADKACFEAIKANVREDIPVIDMDHNINDPAFADRCVEVLLEMMERIE